MRDPKRIPVIMAELQRLWEMVPDMRLGQLIVAANGNRDPFAVEDKELLERIKTLVEYPYTGKQED